MSVGYKCDQCGMLAQSLGFNEMVPHGWIVIATGFSDPGAMPKARAELCSWQCAEAYAQQQWDDHDKT